MWFYLQLFLGFAILVLLHIWTFIFTHESVPKGGKNQQTHDFVYKVSSPNGFIHFISTTFTWGYFKASFKRFCIYYSQKLFPRPRAVHGKQAPEIKLVKMDKEVISLSDYISKCGDLPLVPNFGSYSCPPFAAKVDDMKRIYNTFCVDNGSKAAVAKFLTVYILEAHPSDEWWLPETDKSKGGVANTQVTQHKTMDERIDAAQQFVRDFNFPAELVCDHMSNNGSLFYDSWPERLYIIEKGLVVYQGGLGPFDYNLQEVIDWLTVRSNA